MTAGAQAAEGAGILKEMLDAREGGSGFSFADLSADLAGIAFARRLIEKPSLLASIEKSFTVADYALSPKGLAEGLSAAEFARQYGSVKDERFQRVLTNIRRRSTPCPATRIVPKPPPLSALTDVPCRRLHHRSILATLLVHLRAGDDRSVVARSFSWSVLPCSGCSPWRCCR